MVPQWVKRIIFLYSKDKTKEKQTKYNDQCHLLVLGNQENGENKCFIILLGILWIITIFLEIILAWSVNITNQLIFWTNNSTPENLWKKKKKKQQDNYWISYIYFTLLYYATKTTKNSD